MSPSHPIEREHEPGHKRQGGLRIDTAKHVVPAGLSGHRRVDVNPTVSLEGDYLVFRTTKPGKNDVDREVLLKLRTGSNLPLRTGKSVVRPETPAGPEVPEAMVIVPGKDITGNPNGYAMTLELEARKAGKLAGKVYLCLPDAEKTFLAGTFVAHAPRLPIEPPGVEDVPFINGSVTLIGASAGANMMTGYAASPGPMCPVGIAAVDIDLAGMEGGPQWTERDDDKPRVTSLIAGDGKKVPSRFEHSKLPPGRYLAFAALKNGPAAWKWVDVGPQSTVAADLTIDATKTSGLEVTAPLGSLAKMQLAPNDEQARALMDANLFSLIAMQMNLEQDIVGGKPCSKPRPGRYNVRDTASGQIRRSRSSSARQAELDFDAKPTPTKGEPAPEPKPKG